MDKVFYIGSFPPPYGGVTIKNSILFEAISEQIDVSAIDLGRVKKGDILEAIKLFSALISRKGVLVLGPSAVWRKRLTFFLRLFNRGKMSRSMLFVMGGDIPNDSKFICAANGFKSIYVETEGMLRGFERQGSRNALIYPNCRKRSNMMREGAAPGGGKLEAVFFSLIAKEKGSHVVLEAASNLPNVLFHFYGPIKQDYRYEFLLAVNQLENVIYHGVFDSLRNDSVSELEKYDIHLFPSFCPHEGVPGAIVESKFAGIPTIASDCSYNTELIADGVSGFIMNDCTGDELTKLILRFNDGCLLAKMKAEALLSSNAFCIDSYIDDIVASIIAGSDEVECKAGL